MIPFEVLIESVKREAGVKDDVELTADNLKGLVENFKQLIKERSGKKLSSRPASAALGRDWSGLRFMEQRSGDRVSAEVQHPA